MTPNQIKIIHVAVREARLTDGAYRVLLKNVGGVDTSVNLSQAGLEDVMAVLEDQASQYPWDAAAWGGRPADYWRQKVARRGSAAGDRMVHFIKDLARGGRYVLGTLCLRFSDYRTDQVEKLRPREAWKLIEMLKAARERETRRAETQGATLFDPGMACAGVLQKELPEGAGPGTPVDARV
jgi:hypothetical protein